MCIEFNFYQEDEDKKITKMANKGNIPRLMRFDP
jgi:hypothetical protein